MDNKSFNLLDEAWIRVIYPDCREDEVSLKQFFPECIHIPTLRASCQLRMQLF